jgi:hypothetical protein
MDRLGWAVEGTYKLGGIRVGIRTTSEAFGRWVDETLDAHRMTRWKDPYFSVVVAEPEGARRRSFHVLYRGIEPLVRTADLGTLARAFLAEMESLAFRSRTDAVYLGASAVAGPARVGLIPSSSTSSLAPLNRTAQEIGLTLPGSAWVAVDPDSGLAVPVRSALGVAPDAVERLAGRASADRFFVDEPVEVGTLCLAHDAPTQAIEPLSRSLTLYRLAGVAENLPALGGRRTLEGLGRLVARAECYGLAPMRPKDTLEALAHLTSHADRVRALP